MRGRHLLILVLSNLSEATCTATCEKDVEKGDKCDGAGAEALAVGRGSGDDLVR